MLLHSLIYVSLHRGRRIRGKKENAVSPQMAATAQTLERRIEDSSKQEYGSVK